MSGDEARFWAKVDKTGDCWLWTASKNNKGYGQFHLARTMLKAHRVALILAGLDIEGLEVDHVCHVPLCVRPAHLRTATHKQNMENRAGPTKRSKSGIRGVYWDTRRDRWVALVAHNGRRYSKYFASTAEAESWVIAKRNELYTHNDADRSAS